MKAKASRVGMDVDCAGQLSMMEVYYEGKKRKQRQ